MGTITQLQDLRGLRSRLIVASIGLAVLVSAISTIVANRLAADLGQSTELNGLETQADILLAQVIASKNTAYRKLIFSSLNGHTNNTESRSPILFKIEINHQEVVGEGIDDRMLSIIQSTPNFDPNSSGTIEYKDVAYLWVARSSGSPQAATITLMKHPESLEQALQYVARRLSVTAFLTFWLAVWSALFVSALIVKRVKKNNELLSFMATHDPLTSLPNRVKLIECIEEFTRPHKTLDISKPNQSRAALLLIDLDRFKEVNDTLGHAVGDDLLIALSKKFREVLSPSVILVRIGGDEFIVWCPDTGIDQAQKIANQIIQSCREPVMVNHNQLEIGASIGIACFPEHGEDADTLVKRADIAMYQAKKSRQGVRIYHEEDDTHTILRVRLNSELNSALEQGQFVLYYQPKVVLQTRRIKGVEALVRWKHPELGVIPPMDFIGLIEQGGRVNEFSYYIIDQAVQQIRQWLDENLVITVAVNISPFNLADPELVPFICNVLDRYDVSAELLEIELTESASMLDIKTTKAVFRQLRKIGVKLSIDDFGTGMSSLAYLKELEVDYIKIDKSFVLDMEYDSRDRAIVRATIGLINDLGSEVIAEGIKSSKAAELIKEMGGRYGQGYYFSRPIPIDELTELLPHRLPFRNSNTRELKADIILLSDQRG
ncbi:MAG: EAL domain-containing protein [Gammaproteobacteria bacterium]|nr:EAL domain-containing protein [Gammaproteobacteria bacterium]